MVPSALGFLTGVVAFQQLHQLPPWYWCLPLLALFAVSLRFPRLSLLLIAGLGFCWSWVFAQLLMSHSLAPQLEGEDLIVQGTVSSLPSVNPESARFEFTIAELWKIEKTTRPAEDRPDEHTLPALASIANTNLTPIPNGPKKVLLNWYESPPELSVGQAWTLMIRLKRPHGYQNPGGFDYEAWLFRQGVRATGYVRTPYKTQKERFAGGPPGTFGDLNSLRREGPGDFWVHGARQWLQKRIAKNLGGSPFQGIITALTIGEKDAISTEQWQVFTGTGTNHLIAISGLHIGLIAGLVFFAGRWLWSRWSFATLRLPAQKAAALMALLAAAGYSAMAGFAIPTQRALAMIAVVMLSLLLQRKSPPSRVLSFALLVVLIIDPLAVLDVGFWLSFTAVALLLYGMVGRLAPKGLWWRWGRAQWLVFVGLAPMLLWFFQNLPLVSPIANVIAIPWVSFVTVPLSLSAAVFLPVIPAVADLLLYLADVSLRALWPLLDWLASVRQPPWLAVKPHLWTLLPACVGILWSLAPRGLPARWVGLVWLAPVLLISGPDVEEGAAEFTLLDVGQGLAAVVKTRQHVLVYDSGPRFRSGFDTGRAVLIPYLHSSGIHHIDRFVISHGDTDHIGGAQSLMKAMPVDQVFTSVVKEFAPGMAKRCVSGAQWQWDGVKFEFLSPDEEDYTRERRENNLSCVLRVETASAKVLLTGDIEKSVERELVLEAELHSIAADILVMPHHGSKTSSTPSFIERVAPSYALAPVGYRNRFGFPKPQVVERYLQKGVAILDTAAFGAIEFILHRDQGIELKQLYRQTARRYWHEDLANWHKI